ncbi:PREDICTED: alpha-tocopherol transfer protein-like, partial [Dinoponera quadriceps]|uniref:Alpha-tocopherol transfer protein-like n=1 Tax=Dinoponera quadriceps TaxID=609295 RepID=A0A6P3Y3J3_DINQU
MDPSHFFFNEAISTGLMIYEEYLWTRGSMKGMIWVADATGITTGHVGRINLPSLKKLIYYVQDALPIRLKGIHIINTSPIVEVIYNMVKPFISAEFINLTHFHTSLQSASEYFPIELLPNERGGKAGSIQEFIDANYKRMENCRKWFLEDEKNNRVNES